MTAWTIIPSPINHPVFSARAFSAMVFDVVATPYPEWTIDGNFVECPGTPLPGTFKECPQL